MAEFTVTPDHGDRGTVFFFDASASDGGGSPLTFTWDFGDGTGGTGVRTTHVYAFTNGVYLVRLTVENAEGRTSSIAHPVRLGTGKNGVPVAFLAESAYWIRAGESVTFDGSRSSDPDVEPLTFTWAKGKASPPLDGDTEGTYSSPKGEDQPHTHLAGAWTTGNIYPHESRSLVLYDEGIYLYHCHPHPWMQGNITVTSQNGSASLEEVRIVMKNFRFIPENVTVKPGTKITFVNEEATPNLYHTPMETSFTPALVLLPDHAPILTVKFDKKGYYQIRLTATDPKGATSTVAAYVLVSLTDPPREYKNRWTGNITLGGLEGVTEVPHESFLLPYNGTLFANLTLESPLPVPSPRGMLTLRKQGSETPTATSEGTSAHETLENIPVERGAYDLYVSAKEGVAMRYVLDVEVHMKPLPTAHDILDVLESKEGGEG